MVPISLFRVFYGFLVLSLTHPEHNHEPNRVGNPTLSRTPHLILVFCFSECASNVLFCSFFSRFWLTMTYSTFSLVCIRAFHAGDRRPVRTYFRYRFSSPRQSVRISSYVPIPASRKVTTSLGERLRIDRERKRGGIVHRSKDTSAFLDRDSFCSSPATIPWLLDGCISVLSGEASAPPTNDTPSLERSSTSGQSPWLACSFCPFRRLANGDGCFVHFRRMTCGA